MRLLQETQLIGCCWHYESCLIHV